MDRSGAPFTISHEVFDKMLGAFKELRGNMIEFNISINDWSNYICIEVITKSHKRILYTVKRRVRVWQ